MPIAVPSHTKANTPAGGGGESEEVRELEYESRSPHNCNWAVGSVDYGGKVVFGELQLEALIPDHPPPRVGWEGFPEGGDGRYLRRRDRGITIGCGWGSRWRVGGGGIGDPHGAELVVGEDVSALHCGEALEVLLEPHCDVVGPPQRERAAGGGGEWVEDPEGGGCTRGGGRVHDGLLWPSPHHVTPTRGVA